MKTVSAATRCGDVDASNDVSFSFTAGGDLTQQHGGSDSSEALSLREQHERAAVVLEPSWFTDLQQLYVDRPAQRHGIIAAIKGLQTKAASENHVINALKVAMISDHNNWAKPRQVALVFAVISQVLRR